MKASTTVAIDERQAPAAEERGAERGRRAAGSESSSQRGQNGGARRLWKVAVMKVRNIAS